MRVACMVTFKSFRFIIHARHNLSTIFTPILTSRLPKFTFFTGNGEESLHEGDIKLSLNQQIALELFGDPTAPVLGARGITNNKNLLWVPNVVPYNISSELGTLIRI